MRKIEVVTPFTYYLNGYDKKEYPAGEHEVPEDCAAYADAEGHTDSAKTKAEAEKAEKEKLEAEVEAKERAEKERLEAEAAGKVGKNAGTANAKGGKSAPAGGV